jgi:Leucine-rich repeat (LRR) protein/GTPase SAR1 family protein
VAQAQFEQPELEAIRRIEEAEKTQANELDLSGLNLTYLPEAVGRLTALTTLKLSYNQLTALPEAVGQLTALTTLNLYSNRLTIFPEAIGRLTALTALALSHNRLTTLPEAVGRLTALTSLRLASNQLMSLPKVAGNLIVLAILDLEDNRLTTLPEVVGRLTALTTLDLSRNQLTALPDVVGRLTALTTLDLSYNQLTALPEAIDRFTALTTLRLSGNQLTALPEAVGRLTALTTLDLTDNRLTNLPESLINLSGVRKLYLHNNNLGLPPEILGPTRSEYHEKKKSPADPSSILRYFFSGRSSVAAPVLSRPARRPLAEAKVLVVGQGSVGKTSLIKYWHTDRPCDGTEVKTDKIDVSHTTLVVPCPGDSKSLDIALNVWDFGGQEIYHATHQFFLSKRSLYLLVLDARLTEDQNNLHYWFQVIRSYGGDSPVLVVINKSEQHRLDLNETRLRKDYGDQFAGVLRVSCQKPFGRDELTEAIQAQIARLKDVFNELPEAYFVVKAELEKKAKKQNFLAYSEYENLCRKKKLKEAIDQTTLIRFLHDLGVVLNFNDPDNPYKLQHTTILNPEWVTDGVYKVLNDSRLTQDRGVLTRDHLNRILPSHAYPTDKKDVIVGMMHAFELCFDFPEEKGQKWLIPELLMRDEPALDWRETESLNFLYKYEVLPGGLICRFIVRMHPYIKSRTYWRSGVVLDIGGQRTLVRGDTASGKVFITVQGPPNGRRTALNVVRQEFERIHATLPRLVVEDRVPLPDNPEVTVSYKHLLDLEKDGETHYRPEGARKSYSVRELLDGVTTFTERERDREQAEIHNHFHGGASVNQNSGNNSGNVSHSTITGSTLNWGTISGNVTNVVKQLPPSPRQDGPDLKAVLEAFLAALKEATEKTELAGDDPKDAVEAVEEIAEAAKQPDEPKMLDKANKAVRGLERIVRGVTSLGAQLAALKAAVAGWFSS